ncbi:hypothetical protein L208DRAFT_1080497, partial [Tricholoma matsutake]
EPLPAVSPNQCYQMAQGCRNLKILPVWLPQHKDNPAVNDFVPKLKDHILQHIQNLMADEFPSADRNKVEILHYAVYFHQILRINFTTYSMR